jgi:translation initiation factor 1A
MPEESQQEEIARTRLPMKNEIFAIAIEALGGNKMRVECDDGKVRIGRIPGKLLKRIWIRIGDLVLIEPWKVQSDERCDIIWRYTQTQAAWLKKKGYVKNLNI